MKTLSPQLGFDPIIPNGYITPVDFWCPTYTKLVIKTLTWLTMTEEEKEYVSKRFYSENASNPHKIVQFILDKSKWRTEFSERKNQREFNLLSRIFRYEPDIIYHGGLARIKSFKVNSDHQIKALMYSLNIVVSTGSLSAWYHDCESPEHAVLRKLHSHKTELIDAGETVHRAPYELAVQKNQTKILRSMIYAHLRPVHNPDTKTSTCSCCGIERIDTEDYQMHMHHHDIYFGTILAEWMQTLDITFVELEDSCSVDKRNAYLHFIDFHDERAVIQLLCSSCHADVHRNDYHHSLSLPR